MNRVREIIYIKLHSGYIRMYEAKWFALKIMYLVIFFFDICYWFFDKITLLLKIVKGNSGIENRNAGFSMHSTIRRIRIIPFKIFPFVDTHLWWWRIRRLRQTHTAIVCIDFRREELFEKRAIVVSYATILCPPTARKTSFAGARQNSMYDCNGGRGKTLGL